MTVKEFYTSELCATCGGTGNVGTEETGGIRCGTCDGHGWAKASEPIELHTFTEAELATIADALKIADAHYRMLAELGHQQSRFRPILESQAREASALQLKIEAGR